jgi:hypothetical protein
MLDAIGAGLTLHVSVTVTGPTSGAILPSSRRPPKRSNGSRSTGLEKPVEEKKSISRYSTPFLYPDEDRCGEVLRDPVEVTELHLHSPVHPRRHLAHRLH